MASNMDSGIFTVTNSYQSVGFPKYSHIVQGNRLNRHWLAMPNQFPYLSVVIAQVANLAVGKADPITYLIAIELRPKTLVGY